jgi:Mat/Ecp fimbriae major subunit
MRNTLLRQAALATIVAATMGFNTTALAASATANATATIVQAITIAKTADLGFGSVAPSATGGNVTVSTADTRTACTGGQFCSGTVTSGGFSVAGAPSFAYAITLPASAITITRVSGTETMSVSTFGHGAGASPALSAVGAASFKVGGTLAVGANQVAGTYTGTFAVSVDYQ